MIINKIDSYMKFFILSFLCLFLYTGCDSEQDSSIPSSDDQPLSAGSKIITYTSSNEVITNPERGFMHTWSVPSEGEPVNMISLQSLKNVNVSLVLRLYYLDAFKNADLSEVQLALIQTDFDRFREVGIKCVLRFAYNADPNETDASLDRIMGHLDQLKPIFDANADIIAFVQAGFIGSWGEWYYSSNGLTTIENKRAVLNKLLAVLPEEVKIQVRTPLYKQEIFNYNTPMDAVAGYSSIEIARVGFHNDCFLASTTDYGTYQNVTVEKAFISEEALYVPTGGETCPPTDVPLASCSTAEEEMELLKWTYLNLDYYGPVLQLWRDSNCFEDFERKLGYRIALIQMELPQEALTTLQFKSTLKNSGFAPIYNRKKTNLVFLSKQDGTVFRKELNLDLRRIQPGDNFEVNETVGLSNIPAGTYDLYLEITDNSPSLHERKEYNIRLANQGTWNSNDGLNNLLHTLIIK
jgi:hypothetical protein